MPGGLPGSVLFACTMNAIRSPMAEGYLKFLHGRHVYVDSVGVRGGEVDGFAVAVMAELGIDLTQHHAKNFDQLEDTNFDVVVTLSPDAHHLVLELTRSMALKVEYWQTPDPSAVTGNREVRLDAYRATRDHLIDMIRRRFPPQAKP
jgi:protein-tyrosine-phosphatase